MGAPAGQISWVEWGASVLGRPGAGRYPVYVQGHALRAQEEEQDFRELVRADTEIASRVDLDSLFDLDWYTRNIDTVFERLTALDRKEEPVHA